MSFSQQLVFVARSLVDCMFCGSSIMTLADICLGSVKLFGFQVFILCMLIMVLGLIPKWLVWRL